MFLQDTVSHSALKQPDATAIVDGPQQLTYRQLDEVSNRVARLLIAAGCRESDRVGILLPKSIPAIAGMLGTLKAGAIYVPMDSASPPARLRRVVDVCEPRVILYSSAGAALFDAIVSESGSAPPPRGAWLEPGPPPKNRADLAFCWN